MSQELVSYIILGSKERLSKIKVPHNNDYEEFLLSNISHRNKLIDEVDGLVTNSNGRLIVFLPPSSLPRKKSRDLLKKIAMINLSTWGWFKYPDKGDNIRENLRKISSRFQNIPSIEQGIYFSKRLYFSVGGIGHFGKSPFKELSKRFLTRIEPQIPLDSLIIRTSNLDIFGKK